MILQVRNSQTYLSIIILMETAIPYTSEYESKPIHAFWFYLVYVIIALAVMYIQLHIVMTKEMYYESLSERMSIESIDSLLDLQKKYEWIGYAIIPLTLLVQISLVTVCLSIANLITDWELQFRDLFGLVTRAFIVFAFAKIVYTFTVLGFNVDTLDGLVKGDKGSILAWINLKSINEYLHFPLSYISVWQLGFVAWLAIGLNRLSNRSHADHLKFVGLSYLAGLMILCLLVVFLQVT